MQELEQRLLEAEQRAENAETQVGVMEENVKLSNLMNVDSAGSLHRKYQELLKAMQSKDELISELEAQLEKQKKMRAEEAKVVQEKAAKIKEWVTLKLAELEMENQHLKSCNQHLVEQLYQGGGQSRAPGGTREDGDGEQPPVGKKKAQGTELEEMNLENKPPTLPLHRFPSWESRIYAVATSDMWLSEVPVRSN
ncbi:hypothetical protein E5288_WYG009181 [Bos mutus]|uniref:Uncharacterized protein n=1 Tax=Bos mutus TaxID=72004 RepID=A0A6B0QZ93_9CETA|nr:hypothetical protein [Bos mutus]